MNGLDRPTPEQRAALDELIAALERGETTPAEIAQTLKAPPPAGQQQQQATWQKVVGVITKTQIGVTLLTLTIAFARQVADDEIPDVADLPDEVTLEQLLAIRQHFSDK